MDWYFSGRSELLLRIIISGLPYEISFSLVLGGREKALYTVVDFVECFDLERLNRKKRWTGGFMSNETWLLHNQLCRRTPQGPADPAKCHPTNGPGILVWVVGSQGRGSALTCGLVRPPGEMMGFPRRTWVYAPPCCLMTHDIIKESACHSASFLPRQTCSFSAKLSSPTRRKKFKTKLNFNAWLVIRP